MIKEILKILPISLMLVLLFTACEKDNKNSNGGDTLTPSSHKVIIMSNGGEGEIQKKETIVLTGEKILLQTRVDGNYTFKNWTNKGEIISFKNPSEISVTKDMEIVANFANSKTAIEFIDLGLNVKWATFNVGAGAPHEFGDYFAWGETNTKIESGYYWDFYKYCSGTYNSIKKYNSVKDYGLVDNKYYLELDDDVAYKQWKETCRMPTKNEFEELIENCNWTWTTLEGVNGYKIVAKNGNSIFLPVTGYIKGVLHINSQSGNYFTSSLDKTVPYEAYVLKFTSQIREINSMSRCYGNMVRPVSVY